MTSLVWNVDEPIVYRDNPKKPNIIRKNMSRILNDFLIVLLYFCFSIYEI